tara:strand:+ start:2574 stop:2696 length:123 start_codon:yes stop_codon:yes gene_type:complete
MLKSITPYFFLTLLAISFSSVAEENLFEKNYQSQSPKGFK